MPGKKYSRYETPLPPAARQAKRRPQAGAEQQPENDRLADRADHAVALPDEAHPLARGRACRRPARARGRQSAASARRRRFAGVTATASASCQRIAATCRGSSPLARPEPMAGAGDEHVFQRRLAQRDRLDLRRETPRPAARSTGARRAAPAARCRRRTLRRAVEPLADRARPAPAARPCRS